MKSYIVYYNCLTIYCKPRVLSLDDLDNMTENMVKNYPVNGSVYLIDMS